MRWACKLLYAPIKDWNTPKYSLGGAHSQLGCQLLVRSNYGSKLGSWWWFLTSDFLDWPSDIWLVFSEQHLVAFGCGASHQILGKSPLHACLNSPRSLIVRLIADLTFCHQHNWQTSKLYKSFTRGRFWKSTYLTFFMLAQVKSAGKPQNVER